MQHNTPDEKLCPECGTIKASAEFNLNSARADGLTYVCAACIPSYELRDGKKEKRSLNHLSKKCGSCERILPSRMYLYDQNSEDKLRAKCRTCCAFKGRDIPKIDQIENYEFFVRSVSVKACERFNVDSERSQLEQFVYQQLQISGLSEQWKPPIWVHKTSIPE